MDFAIQSYVRILKINKYSTYDKLCITSIRCNYDQFKIHIRNTVYTHSLVFLLPLLFIPSVELYAGCL